MPKPWLQHYPENVPPEIDPGDYRSLPDLLDRALRRHASRTAITLMGCSLSYKALDQKAAKVAAWLQAQRLPAGTRVALMMPNILAYMAVMIGVLRAGMVAVNINPMFKARELGEQLEDSAPEAIFIFEKFAATLAKVPPDHRPQHVVIVSFGDLMGMKGKLFDFVLRHVKHEIPPFDLGGAIRFSSLLKESDPAHFIAPAIDMEDVAMLQYTGGTTGRPKGAMLTHRNLVSNVLQVQAVARPVLGNIPQEERPPLNMLTALPLYHIFALTVCGLFALYAGMRSVLVVDPRNLPSVIKAWRAGDIHIFPAVNTLFNVLVSRPDFTRLDFSRLRLCFGGGAAVQRAVAEKWQKATGLPIIEGYGLSETSPVASVNPTDATGYSGDIGFPLPSTDMIIVDEAGTRLPPGQRGELAIKGPQVMKGYWHMPEKTDEAFTPEGYFKTGDIAIMSPEGRFSIVDRKKDMILVSGFNVYPNEVEQVVASHPGVQECAVIGLPSEETGEMVVLYVVRSDPSLTEQALRAWCANELTGYKRPVKIEFRDELPKTNTGKILRRELRDEAVGKKTP